jgi:Protein of unknown function (DUF664)
MTDGRAYPPTAWDERSTLAAMLGYVRATAVFKCEDLAEDLAHAAPLPTPPLSSIGGFVNHLQWVEHGWFEHSTQGGPDRPPCTEEEPDRELSLGAEIPLGEALAGYAEQAAITDAVIAGHDLDDRSVWRSMMAAGSVSSWPPPPPPVGRGSWGLMPLAAHHTAISPMMAALEPPGGAHPGWVSSWPACPLIRLARSVTGWDRSARYWPQTG